MIGNVIGGSVGGKVYLRLKSDAKVGVGDIVVCKSGDTTFFLKIVNVSLSSQLSSQFVEDISGKYLEKEANGDLFDKDERFYYTAEAKMLKILRDGKILPPRTLPPFFSEVESLTDELKLIEKEGKIAIGYLRLGETSKDTIIKLRSDKLISHHMLVVAATGKGKSNFTKVFLAGLLNEEDYASIVFDPHNEYYGGKGKFGLREHPNSEKIVYYTPNPEIGGEVLKISVSELEPEDFYGILDLSDAQKQAMGTLRRYEKENWLKKLLTMNEDEMESFEKFGVKKGTLLVLRRKMMHSLELREENGEYTGLVFTTEESTSSIYQKIIQNLRDRKMVIIDTSSVGEEPEKIISSSILQRVFSFYKSAGQSDRDLFSTLPETLVVFEEAPRVLGKEVLANGTNIFEVVAREGRKFKVGLCAITQMPSLLPREILSQMNTKVILGLPAPEDRKAVINSSAQNIEDESLEIQMLDKGEAIITSPFVSFPLPVKIFEFRSYIRNMLKTQKKEEFVDDFTVG